MQHCRWPLKAELEWEKPSLPTSCSAPQRSPGLPCQSKQLEMKRQDHGNWDGKRKCSPATSPPTPCDPPGTSTNQGKDSRPQQAPRAVRAGLVLHLLWGMEWNVVRVDLGNVGANGHYQRKWQKNCKRMASEKFMTTGKSG